MLLSKSQYIRGLQCHKSLWLYKNRRDLLQPASEQTESLFATGNTVGDYAKQVFPNGVEIEFTADDFDAMILKTRQLIDQGIDTIYEATFKQKGIFAMADILHKTPDGWDMYEVKASTSVKAYHIDDAAIQWFALSNIIKINKVFIMHINNQYTRQGDLDINQLFHCEDITDEVLSLQAEISNKLSAMANMLDGEEPDIEISAHCDEPFECDFSHCCWDIPEVSVFNLYRMWSSEKLELYKQGIVNYEDIPADYPLSELQQLQVKAKLKNEITINKEIINEFLDTIEYPISFFDFETFQNAVPRFDGQRPYMQMPFQYSLHIINDENEVTHLEFLGDENSDPRRILAERMILDLPNTGSIMAYNQSFEIGRINDLAKLYPDLANKLLALTDRFVDLIQPFRNLGYYHPDFNGSFSIKSVLPAMFPNEPELDYKQLDIQDGGMAMDTFASLYLLKDPKQRDEIRKQLLAYCHLDTLAMVRIWEKLKVIVEN
jgi:hypothetical protein